MASLHAVPLIHVLKELAFSSCTLLYIFLFFCLKHTRTLARITEAFIFDHGSRSGEFHCQAGEVENSSYVRLTWNLRLVLTRITAMIVFLINRWGHTLFLHPHNSSPLVISIAGMWCIYTGPFIYLNLSPRLHACLNTSRLSMLAKYLFVYISSQKTKFLLNPAFTIGSCTYRAFHFTF